MCSNLFVSECPHTIPDRSIMAQEDSQLFDWWSKYYASKREIGIADEENHVQEGFSTTEQGLLKVDELVTIHYNNIVHN